MKITIENERARIYTPYNAEFVSRIKNIGGRKWNASEKCWEVPKTEVNTVREYMLEIFGETDLGTGERVTVKVTFNDDAVATCGSIVLFGKTVARATGRDSGARNGDDATLVFGKIGSGGSARYWTTEIDEGAVIKLRNVPKAALDIDTEYDVTVEILEEAEIDRNALIEERERLLARLEEINKLLG